jgi:hypothetical protein
MFGFQENARNLQHDMTGKENGVFLLCKRRGFEVVGVVGVVKLMLSSSSPPSKLASFLLSSLYHFRPLNFINPLKTDNPTCRSN